MDVRAVCVCVCVRATTEQVDLMTPDLDPARAVMCGLVSLWMCM